MLTSKAPTPVPSTNPSALHHHPGITSHHLGIIISNRHQRLSCSYRSKPHSQVLTRLGRVIGHIVDRQREQEDHRQRRR